MSVNTRTIDAAPGEVWAVLADGWLYALWVVGASRIREVDDVWPAEGSTIRHSVGIWPALVDDRTVVLASEPGRRILLRAKGWPLGEATVDITLAPQGSGTLVTIEEHPRSGPGVLVPRPVLDPGLGWRNTETLRRLAYVTENRPLT